MQRQVRNDQPYRNISLGDPNMIDVAFAVIDDIRIPYLTNEEDLKNFDYNARSKERLLVMRQDLERIYFHQCPTLASKYFADACEKFQLGKFSLDISDPQNYRNANKLDAISLARNTPAQIKRLYRDGLFSNGNNLIRLIDTYGNTATVFIQLLRNNVDSDDGMYPFQGRIYFGTQPTQTQGDLFAVAMLEGIVTDGDKGDNLGYNLRIQQHIDMLHRKEQMPIFISPDTPRVKRIYKELAQDECRNSTYLAMIVALALHLLRHHYTSTQQTYPTLYASERYGLKSIFQASGTPKLTSRIREFQPDRIPEEIFQEEAYFPFPVPTARRIYPKFAFSEEEDRFVQSYCMKRNYEHHDTIDLKEYLSFFRYGNKIWFRCRSVASKYFFGSMERVQSDLLRVTLWEPIMDTCVATACLFFHNLSEFSYRRSFLGYHLSIHFKDDDSYLPSFNYAVAASTLARIPQEQLVNLAIWMLYLQIVTKDRPNRTRMIREVEYVRTSASDTAPKDTDLLDEEHIVSRVLRPVAEAKKYIQEHQDDLQSTTPDGRKINNRRYVVAVWERAGHYRTLKNGSRIWIGPQVCHRNKERLNQDYLQVRL